MVLAVFLSDQRWSFFPSFSAGWNVAQEKFWEPYRDYVSTLKFRGSWGELGNQNTQNWYPLYTVMGYATSAGGWILGDKNLMCLDARAKSVVVMVGKTFALGMQDLTLPL